MVSVASQTYSVTSHATTASSHNHNCCRSCGARQVAGSHGRGSNRARVLKLLVVPPEWDDRGARHAMRIAAMPSNVKSAATILSESEDQHRAGLLSHRDDDGGTNPTLQRGPEPCRLGQAGGDSRPELRSFGRRRTDGGTHPEQPSDPTHLLGVGRPSEARAAGARARGFYSSSLVC